MCDKPKIIVDEAYDMNPSDEARRLVDERARASRNKAHQRRAAFLDMLDLPEDVVERCGGSSMLGMIDPAGGYMMWGSERNGQRDDKD